MSQQGVRELQPGRRRKPPDPVLLERLAETGFLATEFGLHDHAEGIFDCLTRLRPGRPSPRIALAMVHARRGLLDQAIAELESLLETHPDCEIARAVLGTMLVHVRRGGAVALFEKIIADDADAGAVSIAVSCIEQAREQERSLQPAASSSLAYLRHYNMGPSTTE